MNPTLVPNQKINSAFRLFSMPKAPCITARKLLKGCADPGNQFETINKVP